MTCHRHTEDIEKIHPADRSKVGQDSNYSKHNTKDPDSIASIPGIESGPHPLMVPSPSLHGCDYLQSLILAAGLFPAGWRELRKENDEESRREQKQRQRQHNRKKTKRSPSSSDYLSPPDTASTGRQSSPNTRYYLNLPFSPEWRYNERFDEERFWEDFWDAWRESVGEESVEQRRKEFEYDLDENEHGRRVCEDEDHVVEGGWAEDHDKGEGENHCDEDMID